MRATSHNKRLIEIIKLIAPGTPFREGLENVLRAKTGALIVLGESEEIKHICHGGFVINAPFSPNNIYELAKMDGAVILSENAERILSANVELNPNSLVQTIETGIRHRTAERVARQTELMVVSISQRRNLVTVYQGDFKYVIQETNHLLTKANQAVQTLEKYRSTLDQELVNLSAIEIDDAVNLHDVARVIKRSEMVLRVADEIERYIIELGDEGRLIEMQLDELVFNVVKDLKNVLKDYMVDYSDARAAEVLKQLATLPDDALVVTATIAQLMGYSPDAVILDVQVYPRGYRILSKIPRLPSTVTKKLLEHFEDLQGVMKASRDALEEVEGVGEVRAHNIMSGLRRFTEQIYNNQPLSGNS